MTTYKFTATTFVEAENEEEAQEQFANNSFNFASQAECEEVCEHESTLLDHDGTRCADCGINL